MSYWYRTEINANRRVPLLLFLHGAGETGGDHVTQVGKHGPWASDENASVWEQLQGFFRVGPHLEHGYWDPCRLRDLVVEIYDRHNDVERCRLLIVGISRGGRGALELAALHGRKLGVVGVVACCPEHVERLSDALDIAPVYVFHGDGDSVVPLDRTRKGVYEGFKNRTNFRWVTVHKNWTVGKKHHNCWSHLFQHPDLYRWLATVSACTAYRESKDTWPDFASLQAAKPAEP